LILLFLTKKRKENHNSLRMPEKQRKTSEVARKNNFFPKVLNSNITSCTALKDKWIKIFFYFLVVWYQTEMQLFFGVWETSTKELFFAHCWKKTFEKRLKKQLFTAKMKTVVLKTKVCSKSRWWKKRNCFTLLLRKKKFFMLLSFFVRPKF